jgi:hypothetical protein
MELNKILEDCPCTYNEVKDNNRMLINYRRFNIVTEEQKKLIEKKIDDNHNKIIKFNSQIKVEKEKDIKGKLLFIRAYYLSVFLILTLIITAIILS